MTPNTLTIAGTRIRQDAQGRYCLNDLHKAAVAQGANKRTKEPGEFFKARRTQELRHILDAETTGNLRSSEQLETTPNWRSFAAPIATVEGRDGGTFVCLELVVAYGQFVSAAFDLKVIRTFLGVINAQHAMPHTQSLKFWDKLRPHWRGIADLALRGLRNKDIAQAVARSVGSVGRCLSRMYEVGYLNPLDVFVARLKPATAKRWALKPVAATWGRPASAPPAPRPAAPQLEFPWTRVWA